jgi:hypothetical protein
MVVTRNAKRRDQIEMLSIIRGSSDTDPSQLLALGNWSIDETFEEVDTPACIRMGEVAATALIWSLRMNLHHPEELLEALLALGADPNIPDDEGCTPIMIATSWAIDSAHSSVARQIRIVQTLLDNGAVASTQDNAGYAPLHIAARRGSTVLIQLLLNHGADVLAETDSGHTALRLGMECSGALRDENVPAQDLTAVLEMLRAEEEEMAKFVAVAMGLHERLGTESSLTSLAAEPSLLRMVLRPLS